METANKRPKVLGISASPRNARYGISSDLSRQISQIGTREELQEFLSAQAKFCLEKFVESGRKDGMPFDEIYRNYRGLKGDQGLSNSEVMLAAALWGAKCKGVEIEHVALSNYFSPDGRLKNLKELTSKLLSSQGIIISSPVYFGDRSSHSHELIEFLRTDSKFREWANQTYYAGVTVGAKRNGGQETSLIYQMLDMVNIGFMAVGNDSDTTSQYGGTGHAGDVGTMAGDSYGLDTAIGTGRRIGRLVNIANNRAQFELKDKLRLGVWILQDQDNKMSDHVDFLLRETSDIAEYSVFNFSSADISRCIACDICPPYLDVDEKYRCIINRSTDALKQFHKDLIDLDAILVASFSPRDRKGLMSNYQRFIERTRYLRRGDYVFSNIVVAPLILEEIGSNENLHIRTMTSMIRHHTIMSKPIISFSHNNRIVNLQETVRDVRHFVQIAKDVTISRLATTTSDAAPLYNPIGYVLSVVKGGEAESLKKRKEIVEARFQRFQNLAAKRLLKKLI